MKKKINRIKKTPPMELIGKIKTKTKNRLINNYQEYIVNKGKYIIEDEVFDGYVSTIKFTFSKDEKSKYIDLINQFNPHEVQNIIKQADKSIMHIFDILGSGEKKLGNKINWNCDFKSGYVWHNKFYKNIKLVDLNNNADVKVPWELSRFHHIPNMGQAYWITNDEKYAVEFQEQILDWIQSNPYQMSVNWTCAMDVAIRACNWIVGVNYFQNSSLSRDFWTKFNQNLYYHGKFIFSNLEKKKISNNHYISDLVGLVWISIYFSNLDYKNNEASKWIEFAINELEIEIKKQIHSDGSNFEGSTAYHCLVTELILYTVILCENNDIHFSDVFIIKLTKMIQFIHDIVKPNGEIPIIGDMDSGRFLVFSEYGRKKSADVRHLLAVADSFFYNLFSSHYSSGSYEGIWLSNDFGKRGINRVEAVSCSLSYPDSGYYILKNEDSYVLIKCGQNGSNGQGGHSHNDQLSFVFCLKDQDFIIDPGTYVYSADYKQRNLFRSTQYHNTLCVNDLEQNSFNKTDIFSLKEETFAECNEFKKNYFKGRHRGYCEKVGLIHEREFKLYNKKMIINDVVTFCEKASLLNLQRQDVKLIFNLDPDVEVKNDGHTITLTKNQKQVLLTLPGKFTLENSYASFEYGKKLKTKKIIVEMCNVEPNKKIETIISF